MSEPSPTRVVYTALIGGYERLQEQPIAKAADLPFVCFTDDPHLTSETWEIRLVDPILPRDPVRSSRYLKIHGGPGISTYEESLWIDNRIVLLEDPSALLDRFLDGADVGLIHHSYRDTVIAEFDEVTRVGLDEPARVYEQLIHYAETLPHVLDLRPYWTAIIARRRTPEVTAAMDTWLHHVLRYSRRDQLSVRYALDGVDRVRALDLDNFGSPWHTWLTDQSAIGRNHALRSQAFRTSIRAPLAAVPALEAEVERLRTAVVAERERTAEALERAARLRARVDRLLARVARLQARLEEQKARTALQRAQATELTRRLAARPSDRALRALRRALPPERLEPR